MAVLKVFHLADIVLSTHSPVAGVEWPVKIPENSPSCERCTFAWSWVNAIGNREYYSKSLPLALQGMLHFL